MAILPAGVATAVGAMAAPAWEIRNGASPAFMAVLMHTFGCFAKVLCCGHGFEWQFCPQVWQQQLGPWQRLPGRSETVPLRRSWPCSCTHLAALPKCFAVDMALNGNFARRCGNSSWGHGSACLGDQELRLSGVHCRAYAHIWVLCQSALLWTWL